MSLHDYLSNQGYTGQFPGVSSGKKASYFGLHGDKRYAGFLMQQMGAGGYLSPGSVNPQISGLIESGVGAYRNQQEQQGYGMAAAGINPAIAGQMLGQQEGQYQSMIGQQIAGFEGQRQERVYQAGESFVQFQSAIEAENTARAENARRYRKQMRDQKKARRWSQFMGVMGGAMQAGGMMMGMPMMPGMGGPGMTPSADKAFNNWEPGAYNSTGGGWSSWNNQPWDNSPKWQPPSNQAPPGPWNNYF